LQSENFPGADQIEAAERHGDSAEAWRLASVLVKAVEVGAFAV